MALLLYKATQRARRMNIEKARRATQPRPRRPLPARKRFLLSPPLPHFPLLSSLSLSPNCVTSQKTCLATGAYIRTLQKNSPRIVEPFHSSSRTSFLQCHTLSMRFVTFQLAITSVKHVCTPALSLRPHGVTGAGANIAIGSQVRTFTLPLLSGVGALCNSPVMLERLRFAERMCSNTSQHCTAT